MIGKKLGHYEVLEKLGEGGMGVVYKARDLSLDRSVAIKVLPDTFAEDPERLSRFEREAKLLAALNHPNIATIYGLQTAEGRRFLSMEYVAGETLAQRIGKGPIPLEETLEICRQIAEGLEAAHEKGIIHRDLKPANIKITPEGKVKVLDFGLAKAFQEEKPDTDISKSPTITNRMTQPGVILGTIAYMSPEQARGKAVDRRTDIWAFGCVLFEILTGHRLFQGDHVSDVMASVLKSEPEWDTLPRDTPAPVRRLLRRALQKEPHKRLTSISDARLELDDVMVSPMAADNITWPSTSTPPSLLMRLFIWLSIAMAALVLGFVLGKFAGMIPKAPSMVRRFSISIPPHQALARIPMRESRANPPYDRSDHISSISDLASDVFYSRCYLFY